MNIFLLSLFLSQLPWRRSRARNTVSVTDGARQRAAHQPLAAAGRRRHGAQGHGSAHVLFAGAGVDEDDTTGARQHAAPGRRAPLADETCLSQVSGSARHHHGVPSSSADQPRDADQLDVAAARRTGSEMAYSYTRTARRDRKSTRLNSSHITRSRMPSSA